MSTKDNVSKLTDEELIEIFNNSLNKSDFRRKAHISRRNRRVPRRCKELGLDFDTIKGKMPPLKLFTCLYCGKIIDGLSEYHLNEHELVCEKNPNRKEYLCSFCGKTYYSKASIAGHEIICLNNPNNARAQRSLNALRRLRGPNFKGEPYAPREDLWVRDLYCPYCDRKRFKTKIDYIKHLLVCEMNPQHIHYDYGFKDALEKMRPDVKDSGIENYRTLKKKE